MSSLLSISQLSKTVTTGWGKKKTLLQNISLDLPSGSVFALLGPNGAGKTTLIKCIMGFMKTKTGQIKTSVSHIGYAPDTTQLFPYLTGYEQMQFVWHLHQRKIEGTEEIKHKSNGKNHLSDLMSQVGLDPHNTTRVAKYSAGMKKRLGLAMSLVGDPDMLIWDEPMAGVDPLGRITIKTLINSLKQQGKTLLFSTHILSDVEEVADDMAIIHHGRLLYQGNMSELSGSLEDFFAQKVKKS